MTERAQGYGQPHIDFAQALVQLARDHGVHNFDGTFRLGFERERESGFSGDNVRLAWSEGRHGDDSNIVLKCEKSAVIPEIAPNSAHVPPLIYHSGGRFFEVGPDKDKGSQKFTDRWIGRAADFPQSRDEALERCTPDTRAWIEKKYGHA